MPKHRDTVRKLLFWEYAKLICDSMIGSRTEYGVVTNKYKELLDGRIHHSAILRENKKLVEADPECAYCGSTEKLQWEHIIPRSKGGPDTIDNMVLACPACNISKGARDPYEWYAAQERKGEIPQLVWGKLLKLLFTAYEEKNLLDEVEWESGRHPRLVELSSIFNKSLGVPKHSESE